MKRRIPLLAKLKSTIFSAADADSIYRSDDYGDAYSTYDYDDDDHSNCAYDTCGYDHLKDAYQTNDAYDYGRAVALVTHTTQTTPR
ncbi:hypothetical protein AAVH_33100, partial [Aphelenchoides avenae]